MAMDGSDTLRIRLSGDVAVPVGGIILHSPLDRPIREVLINGRLATALTTRTVTLTPFPAEVELRY
jgi:hypothetical protein